MFTNVSRLNLVRADQIRRQCAEKR
jgi:hypothetical protein